MPLFRRRTADRDVIPLPSWFDGALDVASSWQAQFGHIDWGSTTREYLLLSLKELYREQQTGIEYFGRSGSYGTEMLSVFSPYPGLETEVFRATKSDPDLWPTEKPDSFFDWHADMFVVGKWELEVGQSIRIAQWLTDVATHFSDSRDWPEQSETESLVERMRTYLNNQRLPVVDELLAA